jgi:hypothetical protein
MDDMDSKLKCSDCGSDVVVSWNPDLTMATVICNGCMKEEKIGVLEYRVQTGICETCGEPMKYHPKCDGCGILTGQGHIFYSSEYRGRNLCPGCIKQWQLLEKEKGRKLTWKEAWETWGAKEVELDILPLLKQGDS